LGTYDPIELNIPLLDIPEDAVDERMEVDAIESVASKSLDVAASQDDPPQKTKRLRFTLNDTAEV
jgi:hypothetical protein